MNIGYNLTTDAFSVSEWVEVGTYSFDLYACNGRDRAM